MDSGTRNFLIVIGAIAALALFNSDWALGVAGALIVVFLLAGIKKNGLSLGQVA